MNQGIATRALSERVKVADELGIDLRGSDEGVDLLLNGTGCRSREPPTDIELRFIKSKNDLAGHQRLVRIFLIVSNVQKLRCGNAGVCMAPAVIQACYRVWKTVVHRFGQCCGAL